MFIATISRPFLWIYQNTHWFTDKEAWAIFRFFAFAEAVSWTLLIAAIIYKRAGLPEAASVISFAGHIHGMVMIFYCIIIVLVARSMQWGFIRMCIAVAAGVPPYGSIIFEQIMAQYRKRRPVYVEPPVGVDE
jgi:integral membrane protein